MTDNPAIEAMARAALAESEYAADCIAYETMCRMMKAALTAYHEHLAAAGFAVVPVEPTEAMVSAGEDASGYFPAEPMDEIYRAMIAAAKGEET